MPAEGSHWLHQEPHRKTLISYNSQEQAYFLRMSVHKQACTRTITQSQTCFCHYTIFWTKSKHLYAIRKLSNENCQMRTTFFLKPDKPQSQTGGAGCNTYQHCLDETNGILCKLLVSWDTHWSFFPRGWGVLGVAAVWFVVCVSFFVYTFYACVVMSIYLISRFIFRGKRGINA